MVNDVVLASFSESELWCWLDLMVLVTLSPERLSSHDKMSEKTISMLSSGSPDVKPCHIPGYIFIVLSTLLARSYRALLTSGSVTVSASPCKTKNGIVTCRRNTNVSPIALSVDTTNMHVAYFSEILVKVKHDMQCENLKEKTKPKLDETKHSISRPSRKTKENNS